MGAYASKVPTCVRHDVALLRDARASTAGYGFGATLRWRYSNALKEVKIGNQMTKNVNRIQKLRTKVHA